MEHVLLATHMSDELATHANKDKLGEGIYSQLSCKQHTDHHCYWEDSDGKGRTGHPP